MQGIQERLKGARGHLERMFEDFLATLQTKGKTLEQVAADDICQYVVAQTFPPKALGHGRWLVSESKAVRTFRLLFLLYGLPQAGHLLTREAVLEASRGHRVLQITSWRGDFASGSVDFVLYIPQNFARKWKVQSLLVFESPCYLTPDIVNLLNDNPWEREHDFWGDFSRLKDEFGMGQT